jgi:3-dehydroquinate synthase
MAEVIKYAIIKDCTFFEYLESEPIHKYPFPEDMIAHIVYRCCRIKSDIIARDERDTSIRMHLNFGHTIGHALEAMTGIGRNSHGESVACGMIAAGYISWKKGMLSKDDFYRMCDLINKAGLGRILPKFRHDTLLDFLRRDKKRHGAALRFILIPKLGASRCVDGIEESLIRESLRWIAPGTD